MKSYIYFAILTTINICCGINRPVYKILLTQRGFTQFLQYDIDTPPLREFTFCSWVKFNDFAHDQTIFNYIVHGNDHILRLWLESGGRFMKIFLNGKVSSSNAVDLTKDVWQHICLSYQSDYGAWSLYIDGRLVSCEAAQSLQGFILPAGGSVIIGYGTFNNGEPGGLEGEIFGANMILASTIERNHTLKRNPQFRQKYFLKNKVTGDNNINYIILGDLQAATSYRDSEITTSLLPSTTQSYISIKTPHSVLQHDVGTDLRSKKPSINSMLDEKDTRYVTGTKTKRIPNHDDKINLWNLIDDVRYTEKFKGTQTTSRNINNSPSVTQYETPPPPTSSAYDYSKFSSNPFILKRPSGRSFMDSKRNDILNMSKLTRKTIKLQNNAISNIRFSPQLSTNDNKVLDPWSSSNFANSVLHYLKNNNLDIKTERRMVPPTIPQHKVSDSFPYASDFRPIKAYKSYDFQRRIVFDKPLKITKRDVQNHQINIQIVQDDIRSRILKAHSEINPIDVESVSKGGNQDHVDSRYYRNTGNFGPEITLSDVFKPRPFTAISNKKNKTSLPMDFRKNSLHTILPFLKSDKYLIDEDETNINKNDVYTRSLSSPNKWHNVKSYNSDYTPRRINMESTEIQSENKKIIDIHNKKLPSIRLKYIPDNHKIIKSDVDRAILKGRHLALQVSNFSDPFTDTVSILKYNHGFLPGHTQKKKMTEVSLHKNSIQNELRNEDNFDKKIKIGNALNERFIIGDNETQKYKSFIGGNDRVPDINRYRSDLDKVNDQVPPSLGLKVCKNLELFDRLLYIQPDGSIDVTHILSPVKENNIGIAFLIQNYKKCSLQESFVENHPLLFIDWSNTPVRLFGGANPRKTTDLCGFF